MTETAEDPDIRVELKDDGPSRKRMTVEVAAPKVTKELDENYDELRKSITVKGFRKGRVPRVFLEKRYAEQVESEVRDKIVSATFESEIEKRNLQLVGTPEFDKVEFKAGAPLRFETVFEVTPSFELVPYVGLEALAHAVAVTDEDVGKEMARILDMAGEAHDIPFGEQIRSDVAVGALEVWDGEERLWERKGLALECGNEETMGLPVPGASERLLALKEPGPISLTSQVPEHHPFEKLRGRTVTVKYQVESIKRWEPHALDAKYLEQVGAKDEADMREKIRKALEAQRSAAEEHRQERELVDLLLPQVPMELPERVVKRRKQEQATPLRLKLYEQGKTPEEIQAIVDADADLEQETRRAVKEAFILDQIAAKEKLFVTEDEVADRLNAIAAHQERNAEEVFEEFREGGRLPALREGLLREKVRKLIRRKAKITPAQAASAAVGNEGK